MLVTHLIELSLSIVLAAILSGLQTSGIVVLQRLFGLLGRQLLPIRLFFLFIEILKALLVLKGAFGSLKAIVRILTRRLLFLPLLFLKQSRNLLELLNSRPTFVRIHHLQLLSQVIIK